MKPKLPPATYIDSDAQLRQMVDKLKDETLLALDTESNSLYVYEAQVCLIQLSSRSQDYIIDPFAVEDMQPLGDLLADEKIEKIFHAAEYDLICLSRDFDFEVKNLFDTMYAARLCEVRKFGLANLLERYFKVKPDKSHQTDNWGKRPLNRDSLVYAQMDTHYLPRLRDILLKELKDRKRLDEAQEVFLDVLRIEVKESEFDPDGFWKVGSPHRLDRREMSVLRELYILRDAIAREENVPPFKVITNNVLVRYATEQPQNYTELFALRGVSPRYLRHWGEEIIDAIQNGRSNRLPKRPRRDRLDPVLAERYSALHTWRKEQAIERNLDSSLILARQTLWELASELPTTEEALAKIDGIGTWRLQEYGDSLLKIIKSLD